MIVGAIVFFFGTMFGVAVTLVFGQAVIVFSKAGRHGGTPKTASTTGRQVGQDGKTASGSDEAGVRIPHDPPALNRDGPTDGRVQIIDVCEPIGEVHIYRDHIDYSRPN